jgi:hypothetical protein
MKLVFASALLIGSASMASAASVVVDAFNNSSSGGTGAAAISLTAGQSFTVTVDAGDLWNAGDLPRWSNADGLTGDLYATGSDDSGQSVGTLIGINFGLHSQGNLSAAYGTLVGQIDSGDYFVVGTNYAGVAAATGTLNLYYWDSNAGDNSQFITADVQAVPEPATMAVLSLGLVAAARRRARK